MPLIGWDKLSLLINYSRTQVKRLEDDNCFPKRILPPELMARESVGEKHRGAVLYIKATWDLAEVVSTINRWKRSRSPNGEITHDPDENIEELNARLETIIRKRKKAEAEARKAAKLAAREGTVRPSPAP
jgi:hypothetical protein